MKLIDARCAPDEAMNNNLLLRGEKSKIKARSLEIMTSWRADIGEGLAQRGKIRRQIEGKAAEEVDTLHQSRIAQRHGVQQQS
eukprot:scaffold581559_cov17-Prasinocladus_malaysianus.AAC.1